MQRQLAALVEQPSKQTFLAARDAVLRRSLLPLTATDLADLERLLDRGEHEAVLDRIDALPPAKVLSPRVHCLAAEAAAALGDEEDLELERALYVITLQGLLATGSGTPADPYVVCQATDEYDVAMALGHEPASQSLVEHESRLCDVLVCADGRELWFDVTEQLVPSRPRPQAARRQRNRARRLPARRVRR
jgi:hypothetical protein